jgi:PIN domain nuclease of toxin-antitoxin system
VAELFVADTCALLRLWGVKPDLGPGAAAAFDAVGRGAATLLVPAVALVEICYLEEKGKLPPGTTSRADLFIDAPGVSLAPLDRDVARAVTRVSRVAVPDMPDRMIAATALTHGATLLTLDMRITAWGGVTVVWG